MCWDLPEPFISNIEVKVDHLDHYNHVNNADYLKFIEAVSWAHSEHLGLSFADYQALDTALVVVRHELDYIAPAYLGDQLQLATWIVGYDQRNRVVRRFQLRRLAEGKTLLRAYTRFACVSLSRHRPKRLPDAFNRVYLPAVVKEKEAIS